MPISPVPVIAALAAGAVVGGLGGNYMAKKPAGDSATVAMCGKDAFLPAGDGVTSAIKTSSGLIWQTVKAGAGAKPGKDDVVLVAYHGTLNTGATFDANRQAPMPVSGVVPGFSEALKLMQRGGIYRICIPGNLAYGANSPSPAIPANSALRFEVELFEFKSMAEIQAAQKAMEEAQKKGGAPQPMPQPK